MSKYKIDITKQNWERYYSAISDYFGYGFAPIKNDLKNPHEYTGIYRSEIEETIEVYLENNRLFCAFRWPRLELIPKGGKDCFYIKAFLHELRFKRAFEKVASIKVEDKDIAGLWGKEYNKIQVSYQLFSFE